MTGRAYKTIVADPPWEHPDSGRRTQSKAGNWNEKWLGYESKVPYSRMTLDEIKALPVASLAADDAHLYLWTTNGFLRRSFEVIDAWGFKFSTLLTWWQMKRPYNHNGAPAHSAKPEAFLDRVEQVSPEPRIELFARRARFGWDYWGDESLGTAQMEVAS